jgi:hypothetical protein
MTEQPTVDAPAQDEDDGTTLDDHVGEPTEPDHDLNVDDFDDEPDEDGAES